MKKNISTRTSSRKSPSKSTARNNQESTGADHGHCAIPDFLGCQSEESLLQELSSELDKIKPASLFLIWEYGTSGIRLIHSEGNQRLVSAFRKILRTDRESISMYLAKIQAFNQPHIASSIKNELLKKIAESTCKTLCPFIPNGDGETIWFSFGEVNVVLQWWPKMQFSTKTGMVKHHIVHGKQILQRAAWELEKLRILRQSEKRVTDLKELLNICSELNSQANFAQSLQTFVRRSAQYMGFERAFIGVFENDKCMIRYAVDKGKDIPLNIALNKGQTFDIHRTRRPFITQNARENANINLEFVKRFRVQGYLAVPVNIPGEKVYGVLGLLDKVGHSKIEAEDIKRAEFLAKEVAPALLSRRDLHESEMHRLRAETMVGLSKELGSSIQLQVLARSFCQRVQEMISARSVSLALVRGGKLETVFRTGVSAEIPWFIFQAMDKKLSSGLNIFEENLFQSTAEKVIGRKLAQQVGWKDVIVVKLSGGDGDLLGLICLADRPTLLTAEEEQTLLAMCGQASIALENSRLFYRVTQSSRQWAEIFDSLTDYLVVHDETHRIVRVNRPLAESLQMRPNDLIGMHMRELFSHGQSMGAQPCPFCTGTPEKRRPRIQRIRDRVFIVSNSRIHGALHEGMQVIHVLKDISDSEDAERRYQELFNSIQEGAYFSTPAGRFLEVNDGLVRMLGYSSREELLTIDIPTQLYSSTQQREAFMEWVESGQMFNKEVTLKRKNGGHINVRESAVAVRDASGKIIQFRGLLQDITETKRFQVQLQRERDFNTQILNNTQSMILVVDTAGLVSYANRRCYEAGQFRHDSLVGERLDLLVLAASRENWEKAFQSTLLGQPMDNIDLQLTRGNGVLGKFNVNMSPMLGEDGLVSSVVVVMTDVTELSSMQAKLINTEKMAAVGQLVSGVAHEVNNPLTSIMGFADLMLENPELPESVHKDLRVIIQEAQRTKEIVQNLLSFARPMPQQRRPVDVNDTIIRTLQLRKYEFTSHSVEVISELRDDLPMIIGDAQQLQQVFLNILNNAHDAIRYAGRAGQIDVTTELLEYGIEVTFRDNGPGISNPDRILDPFYTTKDIGKGTGLGLSICYGIVREHGGELIFGNNLDSAGAYFRVRLPIMPIALETGSVLSFTPARSMI